jgi:outer membrane protein OmpA-like peptidoglycan-associated protein
VKVLDKFRPSIEEVRIEGHTSSVWNHTTPPDDAYFKNMELSQERTRAVLQNVLGLAEIDSDRHWLQPLLTANGLSSSRPVLNADGTENRDRSRRVEFRIRTTVRTEIVRILEEVR